NLTQLNTDELRPAQAGVPTPHHANCARAGDPVPVPHKSDNAVGADIVESDKAIALRWAAAVPALPGELAGKRRVTDAVCAMIVNAFIGAENDWQGQLSRYLGTGRSTQQSALSIQPHVVAGGSARSGTVNVLAPAD